MRIALDARTTLVPKTGDRTYTLNLVWALPEVDPEDEFLLLVDQEPPPGLLPEAPNVRVHLLPWPRGRLWTLAGLPGALRALQVDLLHLQYMAPFFCPCPFVTTIHDLSFVVMPETFPWKDRFLLRTFLPSTARRAAAVLTDSEYVRGEIVHLWGLPPAKVYAIPLGVAPSFRPCEAEERRYVREKYGLPERFLLTVGVLQPRKNLAGLLQAYHLARGRQGSLPPLVVVGKKGWAFARIFQQVEALGLADAVLFMGYVADEDLPALYSTAILFVYPSFYEGFGLPPLEAMACGTPVVTANTSALAEVAGEAAVTVDPTDPQALAEALVQVLGDRDRQRWLRAQGLARVQQFTWTETARKTVAAYRTVCP